MRVFAQRVLFLIAFAAIVAVVTYRSVVDGSAPKGPGPFDRPARPSDVGFSVPVAVSQPPTQDSSPPEFDSEIVGDILRIRERLRATPHGSSPAVDTGTTEEFAASLRDVIANRATDPLPASSNFAVSLHDGIRPPPDEPPSIPVYPPILAAPRLGFRTWLLQGHLQWRLQWRIQWRPQWLR